MQFCSYWQTQWEKKKEKSEKRINLVKKMVLRMNLRGEVMQRFWIDCKKKAD